ncbi:MAG: hypothetical protein QNJ70_20370 [Xenococcaceae cyanobacterium MO_207.B15]|nr:hypothetical protein [Xenococcaceae cyanobacterium MO_207.B15]
MTKILTIIAGCSAVFLSLVINIAPAKAASIAISNAGFEDPNLEGVEPIVGNEIFTFETPPGWELYDPSGLIPTDTNLSTSYPGVWNPSSDFFTGEAPEGENIGAIFLNQTPGSGVVGLSQTLTDTLQANTQYTLQLEVGNPGSPFFADFPGYKIQLLAGDSVIAEDNNTLNIAEGDFSTSTIIYSTSSNDFNLGQPLQIRLLTYSSNFLIQTYTLF